MKILRWHSLIGCALLTALLSPAPAHAVGGNPDWFSLNAGASFSPKFSDYNDVASLNPTFLAFSSQLSAGLRASTQGTFEVMHVRFGPGEPSGGWTADQVRGVDPSSVTALLAGVEVWTPGADRSGAYLMCAVGPAHVSLGDTHVYYLSGGNRTVPGEDAFRFVITAGGGLRTAPVLGGPNLQISIRALTVPKSHGTLVIVPVTAGLAF